MYLFIYMDSSTKDIVTLGVSCGHWPNCIITYFTYAINAK